MNKIILSVALSAITVSAPVLAQTGQYSTTPVVAKQVVANPVDTPVSTTLQATANQPVDISFVFKDGQNLQVKDMTQTEMEETQGAAIWFAAPLLASGARIALTGFTRHGLNQAISRGGVGVSNKAILNTMRNPTKIVENTANNTTKVIGKDATVVLNQQGKVVTTWGKPR